MLVATLPCGCKRACKGCPPSAPSPAAPGIALPACDAAAALLPECQALRRAELPAAFRPWRVLLVVLVVALLLLLLLAAAAASSLRGPRRASTPLASHAG